MGIFTPYEDWRDSMCTGCARKLSEGLPAESLCERCWKLAVVSEDGEIDTLLPA
jgi:hypothetical protein